MKKVFLIIILFTTINFAQSWELPLLFSDDVAVVDTGTVILTELRAYYAMSDTSDAHSTNEMTNSGVTFVEGKVGNCGDFEDSENDYMYVANNASINFSGDKSFTLACWFNLETVANYKIPITKFNATTSREYALAALWGGGPPAMLTSADGSAFVDANGIVTPSGNTWYYLVGWRDDTTDSIYVQLNNGTVYSEASASVFVGTSALALGRLFVSATSNDYDGKIDEVGVWGRVLTAGERTYLYNNGTGRTYTGGKIQ